MAPTKKEMHRRRASTAGGRGRASPLYCLIPDLALDRRQRKKAHNKKRSMCYLFQSTFESF
jgi:hypothetical protein